MNTNEQSKLLEECEIFIAYHAGEYSSELQAKNLYDILSQYQIKAFFAPAFFAGGAFDLAKTYDCAAIAKKYILVANKGLLNKAGKNGEFAKNENNNDYEMVQENIVNVLEILKMKYGDKFSQVFKSITFDNGSEFASYLEMSKIVERIYYAHAYSSWERGTNENYNGMIRRFIPKKSTFDKYTQQDIERIRTYINNTPRRLLKYKTAEKLFNEKVALIQQAA